MPELGRLGAAERGEERADAVDGKSKESCGAGPARRRGAWSTSRPRACSVRCSAASASSSSSVSGRTVPRFFAPRSRLRDGALPHPDSTSMPACARTYTPRRRTPRVMNRRLSLDLGHDCAARAPARGLIRRLFCGNFCILRVSASVHLPSRRPDGPGHHASRPAA
jgi:hypothetical protein